LRSAQFSEAVARPPYRSEPTVIANVAGKEFIMDNERACVDITNRINQAYNAAGSTEVEARQTLAEGVEVEEGVTGQHIFAVTEQPLVQGSLLVKSWVKFFPGIDGAT
jgi:hypothetical protein